MRAIKVAGAVYLLALLGTSVVPASGAKALDGRTIFRFDTFGDEQLWTDTLRMQTPLSTLTPRQALSVGLKVDADALPQSVIDALKAGQVNLDDPAVTTQLLKLNAVVGVIGQVTGSKLQRVGVTCAICHSTVDNSVDGGVGKRLDGWPNRDLNVGAIVALSPALTADQKAVFNSWGPGKYDPRLQMFDGTNIVPLNSPTLPVLIPPAFGLQAPTGGSLWETYTADGRISYWNNYVAVTQMGGHGSFSDPRIGVSVTQTPDQVTPKLPALLEYQLSLQTPRPPAGTFNKAAAQRGERLFNGVAGCATCHVPPLYTDVLDGPDPNVPRLHTPAEDGAEPVYATRSATGAYRTTPLRALWQHPPYFHDGSARDLRAVVNHYDALFSLGLTDKQKADLVEFLKSL